MADSDRIGVLWSRRFGGRTIELDFDELGRKLASSAAAPVAFEQIPDPTESQAAGSVAKAIERHELAGAVLASGSAAVVAEAFTSIAPGIEPGRLDCVNLLDHCVGLRGDQNQQQIEALTLVTMSIARLRNVEPLELRRMDASPVVLVIGAGPAGLGAALHVAESGFGAIVVERSERAGGTAGELEHTAHSIEGLVKAAGEHGSLEMLTGATITSVSGRAGKFSVTIARATGPIVEREAGAIVVATGLDWPTHHDEGPIRSLSSFETMLATGDVPGCVGFVADPLDEGETLACRAIEAALTVRKVHGKDSYIFARHVTVKGADGHASYEDALKAGVRFFRTDARGVTLTAGQDGATVTGRDAVLDREFSIECNLVVTNARPGESKTTRDIAEMLGCRMYDGGFLTPGNVTYNPCSTTRRGVFAAGTCTAEMQVVQAQSSGRLAAQEALALIGGQTIEHTVGSVTIDPELCVSCLTCLRICPVGAFFIEGDKRPPIFADVDCRDCGSCASTCPQRAIRHGHLPDDALVAMATAALDAPGRDGPLILGLCCQRSGIAALDAAGKSGASMSPRFHPIRIPCAGIVSSNVLLRLLNLGVDHIMVVACHDDNCKNRHGSHLASQRVLAIQQTLQVLGEDTSRVTFHAISSNSPRILIERVRKLADR